MITNKTPFGYTILKVFPLSFLEENKKHRIKWLKKHIKICSQKDI